AVLALGEDSAPAQSRLEALEAQLLEQPAIVGDREAPFGVMVVKELGRRAAPGTPRPAIRPGGRFAHVLDSFAAIDVWCIWPSFVRPLACGSVPDIPSLPLFLESRDRLGVVRTGASNGDVRTDQVEGSCHVAVEALVDHPLDEAN